MSQYIWYQQGDVTIKPVPKIPHLATPVGRRVLAEGRSTGHKHVAEARDVRLFRHEENLFMRAPSGTAVLHPSHRTLHVPPGDYVISTVRVYDHFKEERDEAWL